MIKRKRQVQRAIEKRTTRHAVKHLAMGNTTMAIRDLLSDKEAAEKTATCLAKHIRDNEIRAACSPSSLSSLRHYGSKEIFMRFNWDDLYCDLHETLPLLMTFITQVLPPQQRELYKNAICVIAGMLAKGNRNLIQGMLSIVLYGGRTTASVSYFSSN